PAGARIELGVRREQLGAAAGAGVHRLVVRVPERARKRALRPLAAQHLELLGGQRRAPLGFRPVHLVGFVRHGCSILPPAEGANIEKIGRLSENTLASVEIHALLPAGRDSDALKRTLLSVATSAGFDVSLQRESLYRRSKRLVVLDMDSTLIRIEVIDELARAAGVGTEV